MSTYVHNRRLSTGEQFCKWPSVSFHDLLFLLNTCSWSWLVGDWRGRMAVSLRHFNKWHCNGLPLRATSVTRSSAIIQVRSVLVWKAVAKVRLGNMHLADRERKENSSCLDSCYGDSGGPLMIFTKNRQWVITGIVSYGYQCANPIYTAVCTRVSSYVNWIQSMNVSGDMIGNGLLSTSPTCTLPTSMKNRSDTRQLAHGTDMMIILMICFILLWIKKKEDETSLRTSFVVTSSITDDRYLTGSNRPKSFAIWSRRQKLASTSALNKSTNNP